MPRGAKASGELRLRVGHAAFQFKELAAEIALEMMVMRLAGGLITGSFARNAHWRQPFLFEQALNIAVDGGAIPREG